MDPRHYDALDARLRSLETQARLLRADLDALGSPQPAPARPAAPAAPPPVLDAAPALVERKPRSLERLVAGRGLQIAGLLLVLLGAAFFLDLAFTRGWIAPPERIILGLLAGMALIVLAAPKLTGAYRFLNEGLVGLGGGILYLSLWASVAIYPELHVSRTAAFIAMIAVTAVIAALATVHRSERLAVMSVIGGMLTPVLLSGGPPDRVVLATYLLLLAGGMLSVSVRVHFRVVEALTLFGVFCYTGAFLPRSYDGWSKLDAVVVATLFCIVFAAAFTIGALRSPQGRSVRVALLAVDVCVFALELGLIFEDAQTTLGIALLLLAAALLAMARLREMPRAMMLAYAYLGLASVTASLPALVHANSLLDVLALEAALLVVFGSRTGDRWVMIAGVALFVFTGLALIGHAVGDRPASGTYSLGIAFAIWLGGVFVAQRGFAASQIALGGRNGWNIAASIAFNVVAWTGLSRFLLDLIGGPSWIENVPNYAQFALSLLWTLYATAMFGVGLQRGSAVLRWQGIALFAITIGKVLFVDLASLDAAYRVGSFVGLGIVLVAVSAWYTRSTLRRGGAETEG